MKLRVLDAFAAEDIAPPAVLHCSWERPRVSPTRRRALVRN